MKRVVITGIGVVSPIGIGTRAFWENLLAGKCGIKRIEQFDPSGFACQVAGEVPAYKIGHYVPKSYRKATKVMARDIELARSEERRVGKECRSTTPPELEEDRTE